LQKHIDSELATTALSSMAFAMNAPSYAPEIVDKTASSRDWAFDVLPVKCGLSRHGQSMMPIHFAAI
ncbi:MAG: hypothetical protein ACOVLE_16830, partial [Pirellula staleyi]